MASKQLAHKPLLKELSHWFPSEQFTFPRELKAGIWANPNAG